MWLVGWLLKGLSWSVGHGDVLMVVGVLWLKVGGGDKWSKWFEDHCSAGGCVGVVICQCKNKRSM